MRGRIESLASEGDRQSFHQSTYVSSLHSKGRRFPINLALSWHVYESYLLRGPCIRVFTVTTVIDALSD